MFVEPFDIDTHGIIVAQTDEEVALSPLFEQVVILLKQVLAFSATEYVALVAPATFAQTVKGLTVDCH